jgi:tetratricopeptide (TPR) repeat protein
MKKIYFIFICFLIIANCLTTNEKVYYNTDPKTVEKINDIEKLLLEYKFGDNINKKDLSQEIKSRIAELSKSVKNIKQLDAKLSGLGGEYEFSQNNIPKVKGYISDIEKKYDKEELLYILRALLAKDDSEKEKHLLIGLNKADDNNKIKLYLADIYFDKRDFKKATGYYDEALKNLPSFYEIYYSKKRNLSYQLIKIKFKNTGSYNLVKKDKLTIADAIQLTLNETDFLAKINKEDSMDNIFKTLLSDKYFINTAKFALSGNIERKDIAFFIVNAIAAMSNNSQLLDKYKPDYTYSRHVESKASRIKDVKASDYYFNACMICIELELMDLMDGENFYPKGNISGIDFYIILKKAAENL